VDGLEPTLDHFQRQVVITLRGQHEAQSFDVGAGELAIPGGGPGRGDQPFLLEESDLGVGDGGELRLQRGRHLADALRGPRGCHRVHVVLGPTTGLGAEAKNTRRYLPIWTSSPPESRVSSMRSRFT